MTNCLLGYQNWVDLAGASLSAGSQVTTLQVINLANPQVFTRWRTSGTASSYFVVDFGTTKTVGVLAIVQPWDATMMAAADTVRHRLDAVTAGTGALLDTGAIASGIVDGYGMHVYILASPVSARYWRCDINAASLATTPGYFDVGRAWAGPTITPARNHAYGWSDQWSDESVTTIASRSGTEYVDLRARRRVVQLQFNALNAGEGRNTIKELLRVAGLRSQILFVPDPAASTIQTDAILGRLAKATPIAQTAQPIYAAQLAIRQSL